MKKRQNLLQRAKTLILFLFDAKLLYFRTRVSEYEAIATNQFGMKFTWVVVVFVLVAISQPFCSEAKKSRKGGRLLVKQITNKLKTVCPSQKKNLKQVLSIVSSVDLTLRFTHSRIGSLQTTTKQLKKGTGFSGKLVFYNNKSIEN